MNKRERRSLPLWKRTVTFFLTILIFCIQIGLVALAVSYIYDFTYTALISVGVVYLVIETLAIIQCIYIHNKPINTNYKLTWTFLILVFPMVFLILYYMNSTSRRLSKRKKDKIHNHTINLQVESSIDELKEIDPIGYNFARILANDTLAPVFNDSKFIFFENINKKLDDMLIELENAQKTIFMEYFVITPGYMMDKILPILKKKGNDGVLIRIIYDDIGCKKSFNRKLIKELSNIPNCEVKEYQPLGINFNFLVNYRDHRKMTIIDNRVAYTGGDNLADEYINMKPKYGFWRDNACKVIGNAVETFTIMFSEMWYTSTKTNIIFPDNYFIKQDEYKNNGYVIPFGDGPLYDGNPAYNLITSMIFHARKSLYISTPYFVIDDALVNIIVIKCLEGVDVNILMPKHPDKKTAFYMGRENYKKIVKAGGKVYEMTSGFNHAKNIIVDDEYAFIGTINMDYRSMFLHYENGVLVMHNDEILKMSSDIKETINKSELITYEKWLKRPIHQKFIAYILNIFAPMF